MRNIYLFLFIVSTIIARAQVQKIHFDYDASGNQITRIWCSTCSSKMSNTTKNILDLIENDFQKFFPEDVISYYPNPVKEELFLKWQLIDTVVVSSISIYNINGAVLKNYTNLESLTTKNISFQEYPQGTYFVELKYTNGEEKSIKIIK